MKQFLALKHSKSKKCTVGEGFLTFPTCMLTYNNHSFISSLQFSLNGVDYGQFIFSWIVLKNINMNSMKVSLWESVGMNSLVIGRRGLVKIWVTLLLTLGM
jgi:hypothetical protein